MKTAEHRTERKTVCEVHEAPTRAAHRAIFLMLLASFSVVAWHVWRYGPSVPGAAAGPRAPFPALMAAEVWDLCFSSHGILAELASIFPYFLAGIMLAGLIRTYKIAVRIRASLKRYGVLSIVVASAAGIITPLCACGTITTALSLLFARVPLAPVMALMVTSPLLSPSSYLLTLNDLGPEWTAIRTAAAFSMGIFAGLVTHLLRDRGFGPREILIEGAVPRGDFHDEAYPEKRLRCGCKETFGNRVAAKTGSLFLVFLAKSSEMLWLVGKYVIAGVIVGVITERYMPGDWVSSLFGRKDALSIVWITLGSVPLFLHQISASSVLSHIRTALDGTLDGGAGLAFMIGGPVTAIPTMVLFWTVFRKRVFFLYLFVCIAGTLIVSFAARTLVFVPHADTGNPLLERAGSVSGGSAAVLTKEDRLVRMVLDPRGKGLVALKRDDLGSDGPIVFDAAASHFFGPSADRYGNPQYVLNVAKWLEPEDLNTGRQILLCFVEGDESIRGFGTKAADLLARNGFHIAAADRSAAPLSLETFMKYSQVWFVFGTGGEDKVISAEEEQAVSEFLRRGRGIALITHVQEGPHAYEAVNRFSLPRGLRVSGRIEHDAEVEASRASAFMHSAAAVFDDFLRLAHKI